MFRSMMLVLLRIESILKRMFLREPTFSFTGKQLKEIFDLEHVRVIKDDGYYEFSEDLLLTFLDEVWIDPKTEPQRHRIKTRLDYLCENMIVTNTETDWLTSFVVGYVHDFVDCAEKSFILEAIDKIGSNKEMIDFLARILVDYCARLDYTVRCIVVINPETWEPKHLFLVSSDGSDEEQEKLPYVRIVGGDDEDRQDVERTN